MKRILRAEILGGAVLWRILIVVADVLMIWGTVYCCRKLIAEGFTTSNVLLTLFAFMTLAVVLFMTYGNIVSGIRSVPYYGELDKIRKFKGQMKEFARELDAETFESIESENTLIQKYVKVSPNWICIANKYFPRKDIKSIDILYGNTKQLEIQKKDGTSYVVFYEAPFIKWFMTFNALNIIEDLKPYISQNSRGNI